MPSGKHWSDEKKAHACWMLANSDLSHPKIGAQLGIPTGTIGKWASTQRTLINLQRGKTRPVVPNEADKRRMASPALSDAPLLDGERYEVILVARGGHTVRRRYQDYPNYGDMLALSRDAGLYRAADFAHYGGQALRDNPLCGYVQGEYGVFWIWKLTDEPITAEELMR